jgi:hypothetical protein
MLNKKLLIEMQQYIEYHLTVITLDVCETGNYSILEDIQPIELEDYLKNNRKPTLKQVLFSFIDRKGAMPQKSTKGLELTANIFQKYDPIQTTGLGRIPLSLLP